MDQAQFDSLQIGDKVRVRKSGKVYFVRYTGTADSGERYHHFQQIRRNAKGVVGPYGPAFVSLKPANVDRVNVRATAFGLLSLIQLPAPVESSAAKQELLEIEELLCVLSGEPEMDRLVERTFARRREILEII